MILVTGAAGHLGNVLLRELLAQGIKDIRAFAFHSEDCSHIGEMVSEIFRGDITNPEDVRRAVQGCDCVFHLAGVVQINGDPSLVRRVNAGGTKNVVEACKDCGVEKLIYVSSVHVLLPNGNNAINESCAIVDADSAQDAYAASKAEATRTVTEAGEFLDVRIAYPTAVVGPYSYQHSLTNKAVEVLTREKPVQFYCDGAYDFIDVRDVARGLVEIMQRGTRGRGYILAGGSVTIGELIDIISAESNRKRRKIKAPLWLTRLGLSVATWGARRLKKNLLLDRDELDVLTSGVTIDGSRARDELGFSPMPLKTTIADTVKWVGRSKKRA